MNTQTLLVYLKIHELDLIMAATIAVVGLFLSQYTKKMMFKVVSHNAGDHTVKFFVINLCYLFILAIISIMVLNKLGVPTTSLIAVLGASSLAIALSLKDSLSNIAAGVILIFQKPFKIGDTVTIDNITGSVKLINIYNTIIVASSNDSISLPNSKVVNEKIINHTNHQKRKLILPLYVPYQEDIEKVKNCLNDLFSSHAMVLKDPAYTVIVSNLDTTGVLLNINLWVKTADYNTLKPEALEKIKQLFDAQKISFVTVNTSTNTN